ARLDARRAARRRADRADRGDGRPVLHPFRQEHVLVRPAGARAAVPPAGHPREAAHMIAWLIEGVPRRGLLSLAVLLAALLVAPWLAHDYLVTVLIILLYFPYPLPASHLTIAFPLPL